MTATQAAATRANSRLAFAVGQSAPATHARCFVWSSRANPAPSFSADRFHVHAQEGLSVDYAPQAGSGLGTRWVVVGGYTQFIGETISTWTGARLTDGGAWTDNSDRSAKENFKPVDSREVLQCVAALPVQEWNYKTEGPAVRHIGPVAQDFYAAFRTGADDKHLAALDNSDRSAKENFKPVDSREVLQCVAALPVQEWNYKTEGPAVRHIGPVAQDFYAAFRTGADDKHLAALDSAGVALAAIQGLNEKLEEQLRRKDAQLACQQQQITELLHRLGDLEKKLHTSETK